MDINNLITLQIMMFLIMGIGIFAYKKGIIRKEAKQTLIDLIIYIVLPCNTIQAFDVEMDRGILVSSIRILGIAFAVQIICVLLSKLLFRKVEHNKKMVLENATICSNASFLGNPVVEGIYGIEGKLYGTIYLIPLRIFMWSAGLACFTKADSKEVVRKVITHPCILATVFGFLWMVSGIQMPAVMLRTITTIGNSNAALSMLVIGVILAEVDYRTVVTKLTLYYCFVRLILIPGLFLGLGMLLHIEPLLIGVTVVLAGMPAGSMTAILAAKYQGDEEFASKCIFISTVLSMITVPLFCYILQLLTA